MQKIITKREKVILNITIGLIIFSILFNFLLAPLMKRAEVLNREIRITSLKLKKYLSLLSQEGAIKNKYSQFTVRQRESNEAQDAAVSALAVLETIAKDSGIHIIDMRPEATKSLELYKEIVIDLRTEGTVEGYLKFLYSIENSLALLKIKRFQLNAKPNSQLLEGNFSVSQLSLAE